MKHSKRGKIKISFLFLQLAKSCISERKSRKIQPPAVSQKMIPRKYEFLVFAFLMSAFMSFFMSLFVSFLNLGFSPDFFQKWIRSWIFGFLVAFPVVSVVAPVVRKITTRLVKS